MKRVLLISNPHCGGAERVTILFGKLLHDSGYDVELLVYRQTEEDHCDILSFVPEYFKVSYVTCRYRFLFFNLFVFLKKSNADYVFSSLPLINHMIIPLVKLFFRDKKVIIRECNTPSRHPSAIIRKNRMLYRYADGIISQTEDMAQEMAEVYGLRSDRITTLINPVDTELINEKIRSRYEFPAGKNIYVAVGRVQPQKDYTTMIKAFAEVLETRTDSMLYIIGNDSGEYSDRQKALVNSLGIQDKVVFTGFQDNPYKYMSCADCFVLSSEYEGLPNTLLDAVYLNMHVVATASIPFIPRLISLYSKGRCVPVGNSSLLAKAMVEVLNASSECKKSCGGLLQSNIQPLFELFQ